jgi:hypothetical protein
LRAGEDVIEAPTFPGLCWVAKIRYSNGRPALAADGADLIVFLDSESINTLISPVSEGVYFKTDSGFRFFVEKDFPCAHPHSPDAEEESTERFEVTAAFELRKKLSTK